MRKLTRLMLLGLAVLLVGSAAVYAANSDSMVSLSYLNGTYMSQVYARLSGMMGNLQQAYEAAADRLAQKTGEGAQDTGWTSTSSFQPLYPRAGETVTLSAGSGLMWYSGTGGASSVLLDVTDGTELAAGAPLTVGHRYLAEQEAVITAVSTSSCGAEGLWRTTATGTAPIQLPFKDVALGDWYYDAVSYVVQQGLFNGTTTTTFEPNSPMNRAMLATVLYRIDGEPAVTGNNPFTDVPAYEWYVNQIIWAYQAGVVTGTTTTTFSPKAAVTREQIAALLYRYSLYRGYDVSARASITGFYDCGQVSPYAQEGVSWAVAEGLMIGSDGKLNPGKGATRAEVATMLQRYQDWMSKR